MARMNCAECGVQLPPPGTGRPRTYCERCSPRRRTPKPAHLEVLPTPEPGPVEVATVAELERIEQTDGPMPAVAILLAQRIDSKVDSGAGLATLSKTLRELLENLAATSPQPTQLDLLRLRRDRKRGIIR